MLKHGLRIVFFVAAFALFGIVGARAQAACTGAVTGISLLEGGPAVHVTVVNPATCAAVPVNELSIVPGTVSGCAAGLVAALGTATKVGYTFDATGINFQAVANATGMAACSMEMIYTDGTQVLGYNLSLSLNSGIVSIETTSP